MFEADEARTRELLALVQDGMPVVGAARQVGYSKAGAYKALARVGHVCDGGRPRRSCDREKASAMLFAGASNRSVARVTNCSLTAVHRMRQRMGIPPNHTVGQTGMPVVVTFLEDLGMNVKVMPYLHRFDLIIEGERYELKCAELYRSPSTGQAEWTFCLAGSASGAKENDFVRVVNGVAFKDYSRTCDYLLLAGFTDGALTHLFRVPSNAVNYGRRTLKRHPTLKGMRDVWHSGA